VNRIVIFQTFFYSKLCKQKELGRLAKKIKPEIMVVIHAPLHFRSSHLPELSNQDDFAHPAADSSVDVIFCYQNEYEAISHCSTQGKMLGNFTFLYLIYDIRYLCRNFMCN